MANVLEGCPMKSIQKKIIFQAEATLQIPSFMTNHPNLRTSNAFVYSLLTSQFPRPSLRTRPLQAAQNR